MNIVELAQGQISQRMHHGQLVEAYPFVGIQHASTPQFRTPSDSVVTQRSTTEGGIGLRIPATSEAVFYGVGGPLLLIQSWRAMQILEQVPTTDPGALKHCYLLTDKQPHPIAVEGLANILGRAQMRTLEGDKGIHIPLILLEFRDVAKTALGLGQVYQMYKEISRSVPDQNVLEQMVKTLQEHHLDFSVHELIEEVKTGLLITPLVTAIIQSQLASE